MVEEKPITSNRKLSEELESLKDNIFKGLDDDQKHTNSWEFPHEYSVDKKENTFDTFL